MRFPQEEAVTKVGKTVQVRDEALAHEGIASGTSATVIDAHAQFGGIWVVCVQFAFEPDHWLLLPFTKEEFERVFDEHLAGGLCPEQESEESVRHEVLMGERP